MGGYALISCSYRASHVLVSPRFLRVQIPISSINFFGEALARLSFTRLVVVSGKGVGACVSLPYWI